MSERKNTPVQQRYKDVHTLHEAGVPLIPEQLAIATGGDPADFTEVRVVLSTEELHHLGSARDARLIRMAGMEPNDEGVIGAALVVEDVKRGISWLLGKL